MSFCLAALAAENRRFWLSSDVEATALSMSLAGA